MREINLQDEKLFNILEDRKKIFKEIETKNKIIADTDNERTKLSYKMERLKDKTKVLVEKHKIELSEFEEISVVSIEKGKITVSIYNKLEEYKKMLLDKKNNKLI